MGKENPGKASVVSDPGLKADLERQAQGNSSLQTAQDCEATLGRGHTLDFADDSTDSGSPQTHSGNNRGEGLAIWGKLSDPL